MYNPLRGTLLEFFFVAEEKVMNTVVLKVECISYKNFKDP